VKGVIKQTQFVSFAGTAPSDVMKKPPVEKTRSINNGEEPMRQLRADVAAMTEKELEEQRTRERHEEEYERIKQHYLIECEQALTDAKEEVRQILKEATERADSMREAAERECEQLRKQAEESGHTEGFAVGEKAGYDMGFAKGQAECHDSIKEVAGILSRIDGEKEQIFKEHENKLFDLIFSISNKITANSLTQKDKSVISKMLKEAAKDFRTSSFIKVSLSKLDVEESVNVDIEDLTRIFGENQHIEFEILKDAPKGTLILDNGSEIADASISTQLKMIQNLGQGKFKHKPEDDEVEEEAEE
jgi:flagellar assembly protein FliH